MFKRNHSVQLSPPAALPLMIAMDKSSLQSLQRTAALTFTKP